MYGKQDIEAIRSGFTINFLMFLLNGLYRYSLKTALWCL